MGQLVFQTKSIGINQSATFEFESDIQSYSVGLSGFNMEVRSGGKEILNLKVSNFAISLDAEAQGDNAVKVSPSIVLTDDQGHDLNPADAYNFVAVTVIAWLAGGQENDVVLANRNNIKDGTVSPAVPNPSGEDPEVVEPFISGFELSFGTVSQELLSLNVGTDIRFDEKNNFEIESVSKMANSTTVAGSIDAGLVAIIPDMPAYEVSITYIRYTGSPDFNKCHPVTFSADVKSAAVLMQNFELKFDQPRTISDISGGGWLNGQAGNKLPDPPIVGKTVNLNSMAQLFVAIGNDFYWGDVSTRLIVIAELSDE